MSRAIIKFISNQQMSKSNYGLYTIPCQGFLPCNNSVIQCVSQSRGFTPAIQKSHFKFKSITYLQIQAYSINSDEYHYTYYSMRFMGQQLDKFSTFRKFNFIYEYVREKDSSIVKLQNNLKAVSRFLGQQWWFSLDTVRVKFLEEKRVYFK